MTTIVATDEDTPDTIYRKLRNAERKYLDAMYAAGRLDVAMHAPLVIEMTSAQLRRFVAATSDTTGTDHPVLLQGYEMNRFLPDYGMDDAITALWPWRQWKAQRHVLRIALREARTLRRIWREGDGDFERTLFIESIHHMEQDTK